MDSVSAYVVDFVVLIFRVCFLVLGFEPFAEPPGLNTVPDMEMVEPLTAVTLPLAMATSVLPAGRPVPPPPEPPGRPPPLANPPPPPANPPPAPLAPDPVVLVHVPDDDAGRTETVLAVTVVFDFFEGVPVTDTQSPAAIDDADPSAVWENVVVPVQVTVV